MSNMYDPIETAMYDMVHDFPGGAVKLAARVNMNAGTLNNKINPSMESHHLTLKEAVNLMLATNDLRLLHAIGTELGFVCVPVGHLAGVSDIEFLSVFSRAMSEVGDMSQAVYEAFSDGKITRKEVELVRKETVEAMAALAELPSRLESMCDE